MANKTLHSVDLAPIQIRYDSEANALHISFQVKARVSRTVTLSDDEFLAADYSTSGQLLGIELLNAKQSLSHLEKLKNLIQPAAYGQILLAAKVAVYQSKNDV